MLIDAAKSVLVVVDLQEKLLPVLDQAGEMIDNTRRLIVGARVSGVPVYVTEQYPEGLGGTVMPVREVLPPAAHVIDKISFSAADDPVFISQIRNLDRARIILCGAEAHVCVLQTALGLITAGFEVAVVLDAITSRSRTSHSAAIHRMSANGVEIVTTEMVLFEWCRRAQGETFREISFLVKEGVQTTPAE